MRKPKPVIDQLRRHLRNRKAVNAGQSYEHIKPAVGRSTWFNWMSGRSCLSVDNLQQILDKLGLQVHILDKDGRTGTGRKL